MDMTQLNDYTTRSEAVCRRNDTISPRLYEEYGVKKGLRDENGNGVLAGLTNISKITSSRIVDGKKVPCDGQLWYRGYRVEDLIGSLGETELGYEKIAYLLLMGQMPDSAAAEEFRRLLGECRTLPTNFTRDVIMKAPGKDIMNSMTRSVLTLASYDDQVNGDLANSIAGASVGGPAKPAVTEEAAVAPQVMNTGRLPAVANPPDDDAETGDNHDDDGGDFKEREPEFQLTEYLHAHQERRMTG